MYFTNDIESKPVEEASISFFIVFKVPTYISINAFWELLQKISHTMIFDIFIHYRHVLIDNSMPAKRFGNQI